MLSFEARVDAELRGKLQVERYSGHLFWGVVLLNYYYKAE